MSFCKFISITEQHIWLEVKVISSLVFKMLCLFPYIICCVLCTLPIERLKTLCVLIKFISSISAMHTKFSVNMSFTKETKHSLCLITWWRMNQGSFLLCVNEQEAFCMKHFLQHMTYLIHTYYCIPWIHKLIRWQYDDVE